MVCCVDNRLATMSIDVHCPQHCILVLWAMCGWRQRIDFVFRAYTLDNTKDIYIFAHFYFPASGQAAVTGVVPSPPRFLPSFFIAHRVQQSHRSSIFHRVSLTHALAFSASQFVRKKKSPRLYTRMHSGGFELTKPTYTRLEDKLIRHRGDRLGYRTLPLQ